MPNQDQGDAAEDDIVRIDQMADEFEEAWRRGQRPSIEGHLGEESEPFRMALLKELLMIEWQRRLRLGERPVLEEYVDRFPEQARWIREATLGRDPSLGTTVGSEPTATPTSDQLPLLRDYEVLEKIGGGGMGVVYLAKKRSWIDGSVALKMIADQLLSRDSMERFIIEMRSQARIRHPHIVQILDSGHEDGRPYFTMTFYEGSDLSHVLKEHEPLEPRTAALYVCRIAWAVHYLHDRDKPLLHRDLKPQNILLDRYRDGSFPFGRPYLADFGLVKLLDETPPALARGAMEGTIPYMAPEQVEGGHVVPASDVWGLGVILFESLTRQHPFRGETKAEMIYQILNREAPSPRGVRPEIPRDLQRICLKCLRKPLGSRYRSASELIEDLECFLKGEPLIHARSEAPGERVIQWARRAPALASRLAVIVVCSAIIWGYRLITGKFAPLEADHPVVTMIFSRMALPGSDAVTTTVLVWANQVILVAWGLISWAFQRRLQRTPRDDGIQLGWRIADVTALVLLIQLDDAIMSPLTVAFAILIVASAFWSRADQIIQTTLLSMAGYGLLALTYRLCHPSMDRPYRHFHYLAGLAILAVMLVYQANRTRALARIGGERLRA
jgi:eukaryotic-like serine/threonine-protein kinase